MLEEYERKAVDTASTFEELAEVAVRFLTRMRETHNDIVQICGPMSTGGCGSLAGNMERFTRAVSVASQRGIFVFDQILFQEALIRISAWKEGDPYPYEMLTVFYERILSSGLITKGLFLPDWESSTGASWERARLIRLGIHVEDYPAEWLD